MQNNNTTALFLDNHKRKKIKIWLMTAIAFSILVSPSAVTPFSVFGGGDGLYKCTVDFIFEDPNGLAKGRKIHIKDAAGKRQKTISVGETVSFDRHSKGFIYIKSETGKFSFEVLIYEFTFTNCGEYRIFYKKVKNCERLVYKESFRD